MHDIDSRATRGKIRHNLYSNDDLAKVLAVRHVLVGLLQLLKVEDLVDDRFDTSE